MPEINDRAPGTDIRSFLTGKPSGICNIGNLSWFFIYERKPN